MSWSVEKQKQYSALVNKCREQVLVIMARHYSEDQYSIATIEALAEAYRAGAIDAIFVD